MKKIITAALALTAFTSTPTLAEGFGWTNIYTDYVQNDVFLDGNDEEAFVGGIEGGYTEGALDVYGFSEYDTVGDTTFTKLTVHYTIVSGVSAYIQGTQFVSDFGDTKTSLIGIGYTNLVSDTYAFKPYIGVNYVDGVGDDTVTVVGWSGFAKVSDKVTLTHWSESNIEDGFTAQGDFGVYYELPKNLYAGLQYRYNLSDNAFHGDYHLDDAIGIRIGMHL